MFQKRPTARAPTRSRSTAVALAFLIGGTGAHKFYLGQIKTGICYAVFAWTLIPTLLAWRDGAKLTRTTQHDFDRVHNPHLIEPAPRRRFLTFRK
jgi:TM2 domain-containing membrane protein YozV